MRLFDVNKMSEQPEQMSAEQIYESRLSAFESFYLALVISVGVLAAVGICIAVVLNVILGAAIALLSATCYVFFTSDELYKKLGLRYKAERGALAVTRANARYGETVIIPSRLLWCDVTRIEDGAFSSQKNAQTTCIYIPKSIEYMGENLFSAENAIAEIRFEGSLEEWEQIEKKSDFSDIRVIFNCDYPRVTKKPKKQKNGDSEVAE